MMVLHGAHARCNIVSFNPPPTPNGMQLCSSYSRTVTRVHSVQMWAPIKVLHLKFLDSTCRSFTACFTYSQSGAILEPLPNSFISSKAFVTYFFNMPYESLYAQVCLAVLHHWIAMLCPHAIQRPAITRHFLWRLITIMIVFIKRGKPFYSSTLENQLRN